MEGTVAYLFLEGGQGSLLLLLRGEFILLRLQKLLLQPAVLPLGLLHASLDGRARLLRYLAITDMQA